MGENREYPMGFRFTPTKDECIKYLLGFVTGNPMPYEGLIAIADLYGEKEPWELFGDSEKEDGCRYFFTKLKKVGGLKGKRYSRNVGKGNWSNKGKKADIIGRKGKIIGHSRSFRYISKVEPTHGEWSLKEYFLGDDKSCSLKKECRDYVLCVLKKKEEDSGKKKRDHSSLSEGGLDYLLADLRGRGRLVEATSNSALVSPESVVSGSTDNQDLVMARSETGSGLGLDEIWRPSWVPLPRLLHEASPVYMRTGFDHNISATGGGLYEMWPSAHVPGLLHEAI